MASHQIFTLEGEIDLHNSTQIGEQLKAATKENKPDKLVLDASKLEYIDSSGLAVLIDAMRRVEFYGGKLFLVGLPESVKTILESSKLDQVFRILPDANAALAA